MRIAFLMVYLLLTLMYPHAWAFSAYSNDELDELERQFIQEINQSNSVIRTPVANQYINHLAKQLAQQGQIATPYFFIVKSNEINAFAGPGGYVGVNTQLILVSSNESELAAVMAHELSHVRQHHLYRMIEHQKQMKIPMLASMLASIALGVVNPALGSGALMGTLSGFAQDNINFVRANEKEADRIGIDMLIKSGMDPRGMANFFKKMQQNARYYYTDNVPAILRSHPLDEDRIAEADGRAANHIQANYPDHLDYHLFKELIRNEVANNANALMQYYQSECKKHNSNTACEYGAALALQANNQSMQAKMRLIPLLQQYPDNLFFIIAMAHSEMGCNENASAINRLRELQANHPENYAATVEYGQLLMEANQPDKAASVLLKASRQFKNDLMICEQLAQAQADSHQKGYAYFTLAQCYLLQGQTRDAIRKLHIAKTLVGRDRMLKARIDAKIDEIKSISE